MRLGVPAEIHPEERRVAATPATVQRLRKLGFEVVLQRGAGARADLLDAAYEGAGATLADDAWDADVVLKVRPPDPAEIARLRPGATLIAQLDPRRRPDLIEALAARGVTAFAIDAVPRISRAQKMDVLSSMANIAGYRAVLEAAAAYGGFFGGQITAAGKTPPARVLVIGAGVAGLSAIATARGLGAEVRAFDTRLSVADQVASLGARFLTVDIHEDGDTASGYSKEMSPAFIAAEMALFEAQCREVDVVITTALIPGKPAPRLLTAAMLDGMKPGSVVVDLAAEAGGNCEATVPGQAVRHGGVTVVGYTDLVSRMPRHASEFYGSNLCHLLDDLGGAALTVDLDNEVTRGCVVVRSGEVLWPPPPPKPVPAPPAAPVASAPVPAPRRPLAPWVGLAAAVALTAVASRAPSELVQHLTVFVLACIIGWQVIWNVTAALHTPLMAVTNAISGIIIVGGLLQASSGDFGAAELVGAAAVLLATINVAGGFLVTQRMLRMFRKRT